MSTAPQLFIAPADMLAWSTAQRLAGRTIGFVPTMGALHEGHLALIGEARNRADVVVVSIFVNPLQFNRRDDFDHYPRPIDGDLDACRAARVDAIYAPTAATMYPPHFQTHVSPGELALPLEGADRPGHFRGVTTVVAKLFNAVRPDTAVFGQKDYQQLVVIRQMAADLDMGIDIIAAPTVREPDGLALSSRNRRLSAEQRDAARCVPAALDAIENQTKLGVTDTASLREVGFDVFRAQPLARADHIQLVNAQTLQPLITLDPVTLVVLAVWFGEIRLIDNRLIQLIGA